MYKLENFNSTQFVINFINGYENRIIDKEDIPNLLLLDSYDLVAIVLQKKCNIFLQFDEQNSKAYLDAIYLRIEQTNGILRSLGSMNYILVAKNKQNVQTTESKPQALPEFSDSFDENVTLILQKLEVLKTSLKIVCEDLPFTQILTDEQTIFFNKNILESCNNCGECLKYCPTQALLYNENKDTIFFNSGCCIGCHICNQVCELHAIEDVNEVNIIEFAFDQVIKKREFNTTK